MGSATYDFLADSFLLNDSAIEGLFSDYSDAQIETEIEKYREHCLNEYDNIIDEVVKEESCLKVCTSIEKFDYNLLLQSGLYMDQFIVYDPLFRLSEKQSDTHSLIISHLGYKGKEIIDRSELASICQLLNRIKPMIVADYVKLVPFSYHFEAPKVLPIKYDPNQYRDILPQEILNFFYKNATVYSMQKSSQGWIILPELESSRGIMVSFEKDISKNGFIYHLWETHILDFNEETGLAKFAQTLPDEPPSQEMFANWVTQSVNQSAIGSYDQAYKECLLAAQLNSTFMTNSQFMSNLISSNFSNTKDNIQNYALNEFINMELPFLDKVNAEELMSIRVNEEGTFKNFRLELEKNFREMRSITDPKELELAKENLIHELYDVQNHKLESKFRSINRNYKIDGTLGLASVIMAAPTGGWSLLGGAVAVVKGYKDIKNYQDQIKENPSYILWKSTK